MPHACPRGGALILLNWRPRRQRASAVARWHRARRDPPGGHPRRPGVRSTSPTTGACPAFHSHMPLAFMRLSELVPHSSQEGKLIAMFSVCTLLYAGRSRGLRWQALQSPRPSRPRAWPTGSTPSET